MVDYYCCCCSRWKRESAGLWYWEWCYYWMSPWAVAADSDATSPTFPREATYSAFEMDWASSKTAAAAAAVDERVMSDYWKKWHWEGMDSLARATGAWSSLEERRSCCSRGNDWQMNRNPREWTRNSTREGRRCASATCIHPRDSCRNTNGWFLKRSEILQWVRGERGSDTNHCSIQRSKLRWTSVCSRRDKEVERCSTGVLMLETKQSQGHQMQLSALDLTVRWSRSRIGQTTLTGKVSVDTRRGQKTSTSCRGCLRRTIQRTWE